MPGITEPVTLLDADSDSCHPALTQKHPSEDSRRVRSHRPSFGSLMDPLFNVAVTPAGVKIAPFYTLPTADPKGLSNRGFQGFAANTDFGSVRENREGQKALEQSVNVKGYLSGGLNLPPKDYSVPPISCTGDLFYSCIIESGTSADGQGLPASRPPASAIPTRRAAGYPDALGRTGKVDTTPGGFPGTPKRSAHFCSSRVQELRAASWGIFQYAYELGQSKNPSVWSQNSNAKLGLFSASFLFSVDRSSSRPSKPGATPHPRGSRRPVRALILLGENGQPRRVIRSTKAPAHRMLANSRGFFPGYGG
jgi:hypothetical protein